MTSDLPEPHLAVDDLTQLVPGVIPMDGADPELVAIGERYWALAGFAPEYGTPVWCEKTKDIDTAGWGHQIYAVAAAGVRAVVPGRECPACDGPLSLTSRTAFQQVCDNNDPACVECTESLLTAVRAVLDPARKAKREAAKAKDEAQRVVDEAHAQWRQIQKNLVAEEYAVTFPSAMDTMPEAGIRDMVGALALVRYAPSTSPIADLGAWPEPVHPDSSKTGPLLGSLVRAGILKIHPSSPLTAFRWAPESFEDALREAGGDLDALPAPQLTSSFYPLAARYCAPCGPSPAKAVEQLDAHLISALDPAGMTAGQHDDLLAVARELIAEEALRYFTNRLEELHLPAAADNHHTRLNEAAHKLAEHRPLGEIYNLVWRATRAAAEAAQKNPRAPRTHMSTHAINQFETHAQNAAADPEWQIKPFNEIAGHGPAAMTRALFYNVLDRSPLETSLAQIEAALPEPVPAPPADKPSPTEDDELTVTIEWLGAYPDSWNPDDVPSTLSILKEKREETPEWHFEGKILARGAAHLHRLHERLAPAIGTREASLAVLGATAMLIHPVTVNGTSLTNGEWIFSRLSGRVRNSFGG